MAQLLLVFPSFPTAILAVILLAFLALLPIISKMALVRPAAVRLRTAWSVLMAASAACASPRTSLLAVAVLPARKHTRTVLPATKTLVYSVAAVNTSLRTRPATSAALSKADASHARTKASAVNASPASSCIPTPAFLAYQLFPTALLVAIVNRALLASAIATFWSMGTA